MKFSPDPLKNDLKTLVFLLFIVYNEFPDFLQARTQKGEQEEVAVMPVYEYECESCGGRFEVMQKFSDPAITACRLCTTGTVRKVLSPTAFVLKGSGWYATDYASKDRKKAEGADTACGDSKPAAGCAGGGCASGSCASKG